MNAFLTFNQKKFQMNCLKLLRTKMVGKYVKNYKIHINFHIILTVLMKNIVKAIFSIEPDYYYLLYGTK